MLINHRQSAYLDNDELELAAGCFEVRAKCARPEDEELFQGAAVVLRILQKRDIKTADELICVFLSVVGLSDPFTSTND